MLQRLNRDKVANLVNRPVKVLQFGEGNFLRAFVDWIIDILNEKTDFNGAVQIIQPLKQGMGNVVNEQEGLYHVVLNGLKNGKSLNETRLIACVNGVINPYEDFNAFLKTAENPELQFIISNTTEAGIAFDASDINPKNLPASFPGKLTVLLFHRFQFFSGNPSQGLILIPCELIDKNGDSLRAAIHQYISHWKLPSDFKCWLDHHTIFCNSLVDRIVPGFPKENIEEIQQRIGYEDKLVVKAEPFHLWVIEAPPSLRKKFPAIEAGLEVKFVDDMTPYRTRKVRILNGAHTAMVPVAYLRGLRTVREAVEDKQTGDFISKIIFNEIIPTLDLPKEELTQFADDVIERFQNPYIRHELSTIALNSISKFKVRVLPSILEYVNLNDTLPDNLLYALAALICFYKGEWRGEQIPLNDSFEVISFMYEAWKNSSTVVEKTLANTSFWDQDLTSITGITEKVSGFVRQLSQEDKLSMIK